jgi:hypothetical protein
MRPLLSVAAFGLMAAGSLVAQVLSPADAEAFRIGPATHPQARGAVVLKDHYLLSSSEESRTFRIRIFAEGGKSAANFTGLPTDTQVSYSVTFPDGRVLPKREVKDLPRSRVVFGGNRVESLNFFPEGLTSDCLVDIRLKFGSGGDFRFSTFRFPLLGPVPAQVRVVEFKDGYPPLVAQHLNGVQWEEVKAPDGRGFKFSVFEAPALEPVPYTAGFFNEGPVLISRREFLTWGKGITTDAEFWDGYVKHRYKLWYERDVSRGSSYKALLRELQQLKETEVSQKAKAILAVLRHRVINLSDPTPGQAEVHAKVDMNRIRSEDLEASLDRGYTDGTGMRILAFQVFRDLGLKPQLIVLSDREKGYFDPSFWSTNQFHHTQIILPLPSGGWFWVESGWRNWPQGLLHSSYQGTRAFRMDPESWTGKAVFIPPQPAETNWVIANFQHSLEDGKSEYHMTYRVGGMPEVRLRESLVDLTPRDREKKIRELLEARTGGTVASASPRDLDTPGGSVWFEVQGMLEFEGGRRRVLNPFPGIRNPLPPPEQWPKERFQPIVLPYNQVMVAKAFVNVPAGWVLEEQPRFFRENPFGSVEWTASQLGAGAPVEVLLTLRVDSSVGQAEHYENLKTFLAWLDEAITRRIHLTPAP